MSPTASSKGPPPPPPRGYWASTLSHRLDLATLDFPSYNGQLAGIAVAPSPATMSPVVIHKTGLLKKILRRDQDRCPLLFDDQIKD